MVERGFEGPKASGSNPLLDKIKKRLKETKNINYSISLIKKGECIHAFLSNKKVSFKIKKWLKTFNKKVIKNKSK